MARRSPTVAIIGAGIAGMCCAVRLKEQYPHVDVTVISELFSPNTTSDGAAGLWYPFTLANTPDHLKTKWGVATWNFFNDLQKREDANLIGLSKTYCYELSDEEKDAVGWMKCIPGNRRMSKEELNDLFPPIAKYGFCGPSMICEYRSFSVYLTDRYQKLGGKIQKGKINDIKDLSDSFDVVINCTGMGAASLCNDRRMRTARGHIVRMKAPWLRTAFKFKARNGAFTHIIPNNGCVVVGGTNDLYNSDPVPSREMRDEIIARASRFEPTLKHAEFISEWVGFRPVRDEVRLEREDLMIPGRHRPLKVVHNYGFGSVGLSIGWGCAIDAVDLVGECLNELQNEQQEPHKSKL